jgi:hypothetical protein
MRDIWVYESYVVGVYLSSTKNEVERILQGKKGRMRTELVHVTRTDQGLYIDGNAVRFLES